MNTMTVLDPGFLTTVQDLGRPGLAHLGVSGSGAVDPDAHRLANRLVGNPESAATLETTLLGVTVTFAHSVVVAVTGARCELWVGERQAAMLRPVHVPSGSALRLGPSAQARSYLAVSGGIDAPVVMGMHFTALRGGDGGDDAVGLIGHGMHQASAYVQHGRVSVGCGFVVKRIEATGQGAAQPPQPVQRPVSNCGSARPPGRSRNRIALSSQ